MTWVVRSRDESNNFLKQPRVAITDRRSADSNSAEQLAPDQNVGAQHYQKLPCSAAPLIHTKPASICSGCDSTVRQSGPHVGIAPDLVLSEASLLGGDSDPDALLRAYPACHPSKISADVN